MHSKLTSTDRVLFPWVEGVLINSGGQPGRFLKAVCPRCGITSWVANEEEQTTQCGNNEAGGFGTCTQRYNVRRKS